MNEVLESFPLLLSVEAPSYRSRYFMLGQGLTLMERESRNLRSAEFAETYGDGAVLLAGDLPPGSCALRTREGRVELSGPIAIYVPRFSILNWEFRFEEPRIVTWHCYGGRNREIFPEARLPGGKIVMPWDTGRIHSTPEELLQAVLARRNDWILPGAAGVPNAMAFRIKELLDREFRESLTLQEAGERLAIHPSVLSRTFSAAFGMPPAEYLAQLRAFESQRGLLLKEGMSKIDVSLQAGYQDVSRFNKQFKRRFGIIPSAMDGQNRY